MARHNKIGEIGEELAAKMFQKKGYKIIERNYRKKWCEIDIIAEKPRKRRIFKQSEPAKLVFIEVKTRVGERFGSPEESINYEKKRRLARSADAYAAFSNYKGEYQVDAICIVLNENGTLQRADHYENITGF